ncbi:thiamine pyrophosphate-binding protein [Frankia sp. Mgl5]|uniref:thiamine pyrophosphate-binding protein n=1 Tax=Frankia sp. Mgl5 TaxID=2933793 RepID=UPI00200EF7E8|nr:thiamine pyrophosphate-binding protein [Frankia sp. Mgl5]MCK9926345.1 thiamine pyrophosphate-binding protein [Frankia sp. Mgl5]
MSLGDLLRRLGVGYLLCPPTGPTAGDVPGIRLHVAPDLASARLVAEAEGTMGGGLGAVLDRDVLTLASRPVPAARREPVPAGAPAELETLVRDARRRGRGTLSVRLGFDPAAPAVANGADGSVTPATAGRDPSLAALLATFDGDTAPPAPGAGRFDVDLVLAGRGVVRAGAQDALRSFAEATGLGVLNTFTAKGLFRWDSPFHLGTGCLQERDLDLALAGAGAGVGAGAGAGAGPTGLVAAVGVDADECPEALLRAAGVRPEQLLHLGLDDLVRGAVGVRSRTAVGGARPRLYRELAAVVQPLYGREDAPLNPARAAADVAAVLPGEAAVWTEPGRAAMWLARALPTTRLGSARVPAAGSAGVAVAGALGAVLRTGGVGVAVVDTPPRDGAVAALVEWASRLAGTLVVEVWGDGGAPRSAAQHRDHLAAALARPGVHVIEVPVDFAPTAALVDVCGPLVAWPGGSATRENR